MKKIIFMAALTLLSANCVAQKSNVKKARNAALAAENPDYAGARAAIQEALTNPETANQADTWYVAGLIGNKEAEGLGAKQLLGQTIDEVAKGEAVVESINYWLTADSLALIPNEKGKTNKKIHGNVTSGILDYYTSQELVKYGIYLNEQRNFKRAYEVFKIHVGIPHLPLMQDEKLQVKMPLDTIYDQYKFYAGLFATQAEMHPEAIAIFEEMKDGNYESISVNQFLYQEYVALNDTANFVRVLQDATAKFPAEPWFLQNLINFYIYSGQEAKALDYLSQAIEREPNVAQYHYIKGNIDESLKNYDAAIADFNAALAIDPTLADAQAGIGRVYYNQAVKLNEDAAYITDNKEYKAKLEEMTAMFAKSLPFFEKAHELAPDNRDYMIVLKQLYYRLNMTDKHDAINAKLNQ